MILETPDNIAFFIKNQFPSFYKEFGEEFIDFVEIYYSWYESYNNLNSQRNIKAQTDIDYANDQFMDHLYKTYIPDFPIEMSANKKLFLKHAKDLYKAKGSLRGIKLLFKILYNEDINIYLPRKDILKISDGKWIRQKYFEVSENPFNNNYNQKQVKGKLSGATAFVENYIKIYTNNRNYSVFYITNIKGNFIVNEKLTIDDLNENVSTYILGSAGSIIVNSSSIDNNVGDLLINNEEEIDKKTDLLTITTEIGNSDSSNGTIKFNILNGGDFYTENPTINVFHGSNSTGSGATFTGVTLTNTHIFTYDTNYYNYSAINNDISINAQTAISNSFINVPSNLLSNGDVIRYNVSIGNTAISPLINNNLYFIVGANSSGFKLASGNTLTYNTSPLSISPGLNQTGHTFHNLKIYEIPLKLISYGASLKNSNINTPYTNALSLSSITVGSINGITGVNPGQHYNGYVNVSINDPITSRYRILDSSGKIQGNNAVITGNVSIGTGIVSKIEIIDSGFGYNSNNENIILYNKTKNDVEQTTNVSIILSPIGSQRGFYMNNDGFLSSNKKIQDSKYFQQFSYEIQSNQQVKDYIDILYRLMHPVGHNVFGKTIINKKLNNNIKYSNNTIKTSMDTVNTNTLDTILQYNEFLHSPPSYETVENITIQMQ